MSVHWVLTTVPITVRTHTVHTPAAAGLGIIWMMMASLAMTIMSVKDPICVTKTVIILPVVTRAAAILDTPSTAMETHAMITMSAAQALPITASRSVSTLLGRTRANATLGTG